MYGVQYAHIQAYIDLTRYLMALCLVLLIKILSNAKSTSQPAPATAVMRHIWPSLLMRGSLVGLMALEDPVHTVH